MIGSSDYLLDMYEDRPGHIIEVRGPPIPKFGDVLSSMIIRGMDALDIFDNLDRSSMERQACLSELRAGLGLGPPKIPPKLHNKVMVSGVLEPLKVRLITKGESWKYWISRFFQKHLWRHLQTTSAFVATGRPIMKSDFYDLLRRESRLQLPFDEWVSGDYSAATDNLHIEFTKLCFAEALERSGVEPDLARLLEGVIYEQEITYPEKENLPSFRQKTGQLMGSTLSFPILCAVNLVCYWYALEQYVGHPVARRDLPVLINGDDILFRCDGVNGKFYRIWLDIISEVGFKLSLGKNYVHRRFFTMNSEAFVYNPQTGMIADIPFLNVGLLLGQSKVTARREASLKPLWDVYSEVMDGAADRVRCHKRFIHYHRDEIQELTSNGKYSLFTHSLFGGLGFKLYPEISGSEKLSRKLGHVYATPFQRRLGGLLKSFTSQPIEGVFRPLRLFRGLVTLEKPKLLMRHNYHWGRYHLQHAWCPLNELQSLAYDPSTTLGNLTMASDLQSDEKPRLTIRPPDRSILRMLKTGSLSYRDCPELRLSQLLSFNSVWVEEHSPPQTSN